MYTYMIIYIHTYGRKWKSINRGIETNFKKILEIKKEVTSQHNNHPKIGPRYVIC